MLTVMQSGIGFCWRRWKIRGNSYGCVAASVAPIGVSVGVIVDVAVGDDVNVAVGVTIWPASSANVYAPPGAPSGLARTSISYAPSTGKIRFSTAESVLTPFLMSSEKPTSDP